MDICHNKVVLDVSQYDDNDVLLFSQDDVHCYLLLYCHECLLYPIHSYALFDYNNKLLLSLSDKISMFPVNCPFLASFPLFVVLLVLAQGSIEPWFHSPSHLLHLNQTKSQLLLSLAFSLLLLVFVLFRLVFLSAPLLIAMGPCSLSLLLVFLMLTHSTPSLVFFYHHVSMRKIGNGGNSCDNPLVLLGSSKEKKDEEEVWDTYKVKAVVVAKDGIVVCSIYRHISALDV